jgi:hypothetical protein
VNPRSATDTPQGKSTRDICMNPAFIVCKLRFPTRIHCKSSFLLFAWCEQFKGFWTLGDLPFYTTIRENDQRQLEGYALRSRAWPFINSLIEKNNSTECPYNNPSVFVMR